MLLFKSIFINLCENQIIYHAPFAFVTTQVPTESFLVHQASNSLSV